MSFRIERRRVEKRQTLFRSFAIRSSFLLHLSALDLPHGSHPCTGVKICHVVGPNRLDFLATPPPFPVGSLAPPSLPAHAPTGSHFKYIRAEAKLRRRVCATFRDVVRPARLLLPFLLLSRYQDPPGPLAWRGGTEKTEEARRAGDEKEGD